jgi:ABC-2 type transport system ATP-binding protein
MSTVLRAAGLGKKYHRRWALSDCSLEVPSGRVVGLVGPNGAGKSTFLNLAVGMITPSAGRVEVLGENPTGRSAPRARVGYVGQDTPTYAGLSIADHLRIGRHLNPQWDDAQAQDRVARLGLDPTQRAGRLSGGQRAQLALTLGLAKQPELLLLDEPVAALDPLARREFLQDLMEAVAEQQLSVVLSSHLVSDVERACDFLIVLVDSRVQVAGDIEQLLGSHHRLTGPRREPATLPAEQEIIAASQTDRQSTYVVRTDAPILDPTWEVSRLTLEDLVLAYMSRPVAERAGARPSLEVLQ